MNGVITSLKRVRDVKVTMQGKRKAWLVGMEVCTAIMEDSMEEPQNLELRPPCDPASSAACGTVYSSQDPEPSTVSAD